MLTFLSGWRVPAGLAVLSLIPVLASGLRIIDLTGPITLENARFHAHSIATALHVGGAALFLVLMPGQLMRGRRGPWHRRLGRVAAVAGLIGALAGLWLTLVMPSAPNNDPLIMALRLTFGLGWVASLVLAVIAARKRRFVAHRAWMLRATAIALGAGTTVLTFGLWFVATGQDTPLASALAQLAAWVINLAVAERAIARTKDTP